MNTPCPDCDSIERVEIEPPVCEDETYYEYWLCMNCGNEYVTETNIFEDVEE